jgi:acetyltransferase
LDRQTVPHGAVSLGDGSRVYARPIRPDDAPRLVEFFGSLSPETLRRRFLHARRGITRSEATRYAAVDRRERDALVAWAPHAGGTPRIVGLAQYYRHEPWAAEGALVVADVHQGRGLGTLLLRDLIGLLRGRGIRHLRGSILPDNGRVLRLLRSMGCPMIVANAGGTC